MLDQDSSRPRRGRPKTAGLAASRRTQIVRSAATVFAAQGYEATTIADLAQEAGVGQGTVYRYFGNKREILDQVFDHSLEELFAEVDVVTALQPAESLDEFMARLRTLAERVPGMLRGQSDAIKLVIVEASAVDQQLMQRVLGLEGFLTAALSAVLARGQVDGWVREGVDTDVYGHLILALVMPGLFRLLADPSEHDSVVHYGNCVLGFVQRALEVREVDR